MFGFARNFLNKFLATRNRYGETPGWWGEGKIPECPEDFRYEEIEVMWSFSYIKEDRTKTPKLQKFVFVFDQTEWAMNERKLNIWQTFFIVFVL